MSRSENLLIVADSDRDADMLHATGMFVPDPFIYLRLSGRAYVVMSDLEVDRARREARGCRVISLGDRQRKLRRQGSSRAGFAQVIGSILRERKIRFVRVPSSFPLGLALELKRLGIQTRTSPGTFFPERETKSPREVQHIRAALRMAEAGMTEGIHALCASRINRGGRLSYRGAALTSERLRAIIDTAILQAGGSANRTIVAGGKQGCDPHEIGFGPLHAHQPIILDIFPRSQKSGFFGDITRTVVRGRATESARRLYDTVARGQQLAFRKIRAEVATAEIHRTVQEYFEAAGFHTGKRAGRMQGFFHGTGHGLGLEIHEAPRLGTNSTGQLKPGHVVTVEPGLYYPEIGGVRLEDVALVTAAAPRNLTRFEKVFEL